MARALGVWNTCGVVRPCELLFHFTSRQPVGYLHHPRNNRPTGHLLLSSSTLYISHMHASSSRKPRVPGEHEPMTAYPTRTTDRTAIRHTDKRQHAPTYRRSRRQLAARQQTRHLTSFLTDDPATPCSAPRHQRVRGGVGGEAAKPLPARRGTSILSPSLPSPSPLASATGVFRCHHPSPLRPYIVLSAQTQPSAAAPQIPTPLASLSLPPSLPPVSSQHLPSAPAAVRRHKQDEPAATGGLGSRHLGRLPRFPPGAHGGGRPPRRRAGRMLQRSMQRRPPGLAARQRWRSGHHLPP